MGSVRRRRRRKNNKDEKKKLEDDGKRKNEDVEEKMKKGTKIIFLSYKNLYFSESHNPIFLMTWI
jgi:hypothetical protein